MSTPAWRWACTPSTPASPASAAAPYAKGATGNLASEDLVFMLHGIGIETGIDLDGLVDAGAWISGLLGRAPVSRAARALLARREAAARP